MRQRLAVLIATLVILASVPALAVAQTTTGAIDGVVTDPNGASLPGVTVVVNSPALIQRDLSVVTNVDGYYRVSFLPPGTYRVDFRLQGFRALDRTDIVVLVGQTMPVNANLELAGVEETEIVVGEAPNIDPREAKLGFNYTSGLLDNIPTARNMHDLFSTIPGVESGNNSGGAMQPGTIEVQNVLGAGERSSSYRVDGMNTTDPAGQWNAQALMSYDAVEEVQVLKAAKPAEVPFQGGLFNVITKSGGNDFHGVVSGYFANDSLESSNTGGVAGGLTSNDLNREYEISASLGGRIIRDRLWWFASGRVYDADRAVFGFPADVTEKIRSLSGKLTYQASQKHRFTLTGSLWDQTVSHFFYLYSPTLAVDEEASAYRPLDGQSVGVQWLGVFSDSVVAEANVNFATDDFEQALQPNGTTAIVDLGTQRRSRSAGGSAGTIRDQDNELWNARASVSWFVPGAAGQHDFKFGGEYMPTRSAIFFGEPGDHQLHTLFGRKFAVRLLNTPTLAIWDNDLAALYAQDSWSIGDRLTLNLGLRYMYTKASSPGDQTAGGGSWANTALAQRFPQMAAETFAPETYVDWNTVEPRLAATYMLGRSGSTILRLGASRYYENLESYKFFVATPAFPNTWVTLWNDANNDFAYQVGEEGRLLFAFGGALNSVDPNLIRPHTDELVFGISHEFARDLQVSANGILRRDRNLIAATDIGVPFDTYTPVPYLDPGPDGIVGTPDDGTITVYAQDPATIGQSRLQLTNPEGAKRDYRGIEVTASKRFTDNWQAVASLVVSEMKVTQSTFSLNVLGTFDSPNGLINADGLDEANQAVQLKLQGTYRFDFGLGVSGLYRFRTGTPYTRELVVAGMPQAPFNVRAEPRGASRTDDVHALDMRFEQSFDLSTGRIGVLLDAFNIFNSSPSIDEGRITGSNYGQTTSVLAPRLLRLGVRYTW